jgi:hypothetical protein
MKKNAGRARLISILSKFRRPRPRQSEPSREFGLNKVPAQRDDNNCDELRQPPAASCGVFERSDRKTELFSDGPQSCVPATAGGEWGSTASVSATIKRDWQTGPTINGGAIVKELCELRPRKIHARSQPPTDDRGGLWQLHRQRNRRVALLPAWPKGARCV